MDENCFESTVREGRCMLMLNNLLGDGLLSAYTAKLHIN